MISCGWLIKWCAIHQGPPASRVIFATCVMFVVVVCLSDAIVSLAEVHEEKDEPLNALMNLVVGMGTFIVIVVIVIQCIRTVLWITAKNDVFQKNK